MKQRPSGDPLWFKDAIIYELHVRAFADSNGDGIGDFDGLTSVRGAAGRAEVALGAAAVLTGSLRQRAHGLRVARARLLSGAARALSPAVVCHVLVATAARQRPGQREQRDHSPASTRG